jgi:hypothetical protein
MCGLLSILRKKYVKKRAILGVVCALSVLLVTALPGCGTSEREKAQGYLQDGADQIQQIHNQASDWQNQLVPTSGATDPRMLKNSARAIQLSAKKLSGTIDKARATYKNITSLKGVGDYQKYAELRLAQLDMIQDMLDKTDEYLQKKVTVASSGDLSELTTVEEQYSAEMSNISNEVMKIDAETAKLKKDKEL